MPWENTILGLLIARSLRGPAAAAGSAAVNVRPTAPARTSRREFPSMAVSGTSIREPPGRPGGLRLDAFRFARPASEGLCLFVNRSGFGLSLGSPGERLMFTQRWGM